MKPIWVLINRARNAWKQPMAIECEKCGAMCAEEKAWARHLAWHDQEGFIAKREGAVMKLLDMSLGGFAWDETGLRREAEAMLLDAGEHSRYESMVEAAKRLRDGA